jgi:hypothetical protein
MTSSFPTSLPKVWDYDSVFPHPEGTHFEFKHSINLLVDISQYKEKWGTIICGLLNSGGGWFIIGIEDKEHLVKGIQATRKIVDQFQLWVDSLYRSLILTDGTALDPQNTHLKVFTWTVQQQEQPSTAEHKMLLALKCIPTIRKKNPDMRYQSIGGQIYYRLNASTHCVHGEPVLRQSQVYQRDKENAKTIQEFQDEIHKKENLLITKELEKRKLQSLLDQEKHQSSLRVQNAIRETSEILYQYYHTPHPTNTHRHLPIHSKPTEHIIHIKQEKEETLSKQCEKRRRLSGFVQIGIFGICCVSATSIYILTGFPSGTF